jgi:hypothetical protein
MPAIATVYARGLGVVFIFIACVMLLAPNENLKAHGLKFLTYNVAGQAEVSAYYFGTALSIGLVLVRAPIPFALQTAIVTLGGFVITRVLCYVRDGVDGEDVYRWHQHTMFGAEVLGTLSGAFLLATHPGPDAPDAVAKRAK